jgi:hypothetical protein
VRIARRTKVSRDCGWAHCIRSWRLQNTLQAR